MADQRADTPRTRAGRKLLNYLAFDGVGYERHRKEILAIEAEAAAEPAAAEPPLVEQILALKNPYSEGLTHAEEWKGWIEARDSILAIVERAAKPPVPCAHCGSPEHWRAYNAERQPDPIDDIEHTMDGGIHNEAGGSLTATEPPDLTHKAWHEGYEEGLRDGSPRGVTPALDVERLDTIEEVFDLAVWIVGLLKARDGDKAKPGEAWEHIRPAIKAVAARLGSPEDSE